MKKIHNHIKISFVIFLAVLILTCITHKIYYRNVFFTGTYINNNYVGKMSIEESLTFFKEEHFKEENVTLTLDEQKWEVPLEQFLLADFNDLNLALVNIKREQRVINPLKYFTIIRNHKKEHAKYNLDLFDNQAIKKKLDEIAQEVNYEPLDANMSVRNGDVEISNHQRGKVLNIEQTKAVIISNMQAGLYTTNVELKVKEPEVTADDLKTLNVTDKVTSVSSNFTDSTENRIYNIKKAGNKIDHFLLWPGQEFSFNEVVGKANKENGYKESLIIVDSEFVPGYGGGVCQVSSNLYNAALKTNLEIIERHNHGRPVSYFDLGWDATIAYPYLDLKFKNNSPYGVLIDIHYTETEIITDFYSFPPAFPKVELVQSDYEKVEFEVKYKKNIELEPGEESVVSEGKDGYKISTWRNIIFSDGSVYKEKLFSDFYKPVPKVIEKNPEDME
ncbi:VanW family protein [Proteinivorax tanatarense]|uniref:VanW family protein n=1 Tax=Proteinivorax tanatarense TaxID=1260629 RepID=A0AAU7VRB3_9FIRM